MQMQMALGIRRPICSSLIKVHLNIGFQRSTVIMVMNNCSFIRPCLKHRHCHLKHGYIVHIICGTDVKKYNIKKTFFFFFK